MILTTNLNKILKILLQEFKNSIKISSVSVEHNTVEENKTDLKEIEK